ncbi:MAG: NADH-quinone oxidoreductase subunit M [Planctomycetes bacterium]|nr:NADH-quinone oxidoreductase subunit M [Planctomycetota bacterium]
MNGLFEHHILSLIVFLPVAAAALLFTRTSWDAPTVRRFAMFVALLVFALACYATSMFLNQSATERGQFHLVERLHWFGDTDSLAPVHLQYHVGVDGISLPLLLLTAFLTPLAIWGSFTGIQDRCREYYSLMLLLHGAMLGVFCARDLLLFYIFFEFTLIPLYFLIGIWGGSQRTKAANMFFIYTLTGSMLTFAGVLYLGWKASLLPLGADKTYEFSFDLDRLYELAAAGYLSLDVQWWLFLAFFAGFAIKVPLFPMHTWLPLAHTEAPTAGSVMLAAVLLKLGTYGFLRLSLPMLPEASVALAPFVSILAIIGIIYGALAAWVQDDVKKLVAYSSVSHLGFCLLGMFSLKMAGLQGSLLYMVNHGLSTGALFLIVGMIYERYHTREFAKIGGLARKMPVMTFFLIVFTMSSIGLPGTNGFISEFLVLLGTFNSSKAEAGSPAGPLGMWYAIPAASGILLGAIYMLHMARCVLFGPLKEPGHGFDSSTGLTQDLTRREIGILVPIAAVCILIGVYPRVVTDITAPALQSQVLTRAHHMVKRGPAPAVAMHDVAPVSNRCEVEVAR